MHVIAYNKLERFTCKGILMKKLLKLFELINMRHKNVWQQLFY